MVADRRRRAAVLAVLLVVAVVPGVGHAGLPTADVGAPAHGEAAAADAASTADGSGRLAATRAAPAAQERTLHRTVTLSLTPDRPGEIGVHVAFDVPDGVTGLTVTVAPEATVTATEGFARENDTRYEWTRTTDTPSLTYRLPVNRTDSRRRGRSTQPRAGYTFVDAGEWALVATPVLGIRYSGVGQQPGLSREVEVDGEGVPGSAISYLGPHETHDRTAGGQRLRLVEPSAADLTASPDDVLTAVGGAAAQLEVGSRDDEVVMFVAPSTVRWGAPGIQLGPNEFWVRDDEPVAVAGSIWLHEYVHTRQDGTAGPSGRWLTEAVAEYYATHLALQLGLASYADYRGHLSIGTRPEYAGVRLVEPATWTDGGANYWKGALVAAAVDRRIRLATDGDRTLADAYGRVQGADNYTNSAFLDAVGTVAGGDVRAYADRYSTDTGSPSLWNETEHAVAFGSAIDARTSVAGRSVTGPYRNGSVPAGAALVPGETLALSVEVENVGTRRGRFSLVLDVDGSAVDVESGVLAPGERTTVSVEHRFEATGERTVRVGDARLSVPVRAPAGVTVRSLTVPERAPPGEPFAVVLGVANEADRPAVDEVTVAANGEPVGSERVVLGPGERGERTVRVTVDETGRHTLAAGDLTASIEITPDATPPRAPDGVATTDGASPGPTQGIGSGFGAVAALLALLAVLLRIGRR